MMRSKMTWMLTAILLCGLWSSGLKAQEPVRLRNCRPMLSQQWQKANPALRRSTSHTPENTPYTGNCHQLVVLVSFADQKFQEIDPLPLWNRIFNEKNFTEDSFKGSVHDYFNAQSYGQFNLTFDLHYIPLTESRVKYKSTRDDDENSKYLVNDIVDVLEQQDIDWSQYDWDGDGYVDQLLIVYAGKGMNDGGGANSIWPHQYWLHLHTDCTARTISHGDQSYTIDCYCCVQEQTREGTYGSFGTICHEYSHCFGFPDFYNGSTGFVDQWDLMDYGNYNGDGFCPPGYSSYERMYMGWLTPTEINSPTSVEAMEPLHQKPEAYLLRNDGHPDEYYLLEHRERQGWDAELPDSGLVVFHVDYNEFIWNKSYVNTETDQRYIIFPANNLTSTYFSKGWAYPYEGNDSLTNTSKPAATLRHANSDGTNLMSKPVTDIRHSNGLVSFEVLKDMASPVAEVRAGDTHRVETLYRMGRIAIVRFSDGKVRKVVEPN